MKGSAKMDPEVDVYLIYYQFAKNFGWTPDIVNKLPYDLIQAFGVISEETNSEKEKMRRSIESKKKMKRSFR